MGADALNVCVGHDSIVKVNISNLGSHFVTFNNCSFIDSSVKLISSLPLTLSPKQSFDLLFRYSPSVQDNKSISIALFHNDPFSISPLFVILNLSSVSESVFSKASLSPLNSKLCFIGSDLQFNVYPANSFNLLNVNYFQTVVDYNVNELLFDSLNFSSLSGNINLNYSKSVPGKIVFDLSNAIFKPNAPLFSLNFGVKLSGNDKPSVAVSFVSTNLPCANLVGSSASIYVEPICGLKNRLIQLTNSNYYLNQNVPNPFNPITKIQYSLGLSGFTSFSFFDFNGKLINKFINQFLEAGKYELEIDVSNLPSGYYYYSLNSGSFYKTLILSVVK